ncbi:YhjD/YihY/BrkB family envelope integrity protein [Treponema sp.]|uniref:YhjD/YihY/BrkB family envelope integrity protein n=1 Tax=Treponema sp. TaxID=166 RepID=UPI0025E7EBA5|nr:YhjD/YihY/BrkB family envelope integrity protein [Treponema sp.]MBR4323286.1 YihY/virulence factor BrkB family protein [Treponema sp.]
MKNKKPRKLTFVTFSQSIFLTTKYFLQNRLLSFAGSCAFSFLFSVIPLFMMIVMVLVRFLHASPKTISAIVSAMPELERYFNSESVIQSVQSIRTFSSFEIVASVFILWMARRFFASIFDSMQNIFHIQAQRKAFFNQILSFVTELVIVIIASAILFAYISLQTISSMEFFRQFPQLSFIYQGLLSGELMEILPNFLILAAVIVLYKSASGTKPSFWLCALNSLLCTSSFFVFRLIMHYFLNVSQYNLVYGVLGHVIILFMDIFFFFVFFLVFAQFLYVIQFFDELLLGELYLLPSIEEKSLGSSFKRAFFVRPDFLIAKNKSNVFSYKPGEIIYSKNDEDFSAYYIIRGSVKFQGEQASEKEKLFHRGEFFGETACILNKKREYTAIALVSTRIIKIESERFRFMVHQNPEAAKKVLKQISPFF